MVFLGCGGSQERATSRVTPVGATVSEMFHTGDIHAADDAYQGMQKPHCDHLVEFLSARTPVTRAYSKLASISVSCYYAAQKTCERRLVERACDLGGDAVIAEPPESAPILAGKVMTRREATQSGQVIRFDK